MKGTVNYTFEIIKNISKIFLHSGIEKEQTIHSNGEEKYNTQQIEEGITVKRKKRWLWKKNQRNSSEYPAK